MTENEHIRSMCTALRTLLQSRRYRFSHQRIQDFVKCYMLVWQGIRVAYLVDNLSLPDDILTSFVQESLQLTESSHARIRILRDVERNQIFVSNEQLLRTRLASERLCPWTRYCRLGTQGPELLSQSTLMEQTVGELEALLECDANSLFVDLPEWSTEIAIAMAGFLLEYPVSYLPDESSTRALDGVTLRLFNCYLISDDASDENVTQQLMKFSCPGVLLNDLEIAMGCSIPDAIRVRLHPRLEHKSWSEIRIEESSVTQDVIAL